LPSNESYPQYVVTAVIVAHDGAAWLPNVADALLDQTRSVQRVVAVDTGSRDRSGSVLAAKFGQAVVFGMDRATGYGAAVTRALSHRAANLPVPGGAGDRVEWLWLLHDDCEPAPDALEQLLRGAAESKAAAVLGPKLRDWSSREVILEAGITVDTAARRLTGIEPREVDQGQHDGDRDALAVSSAGMLVRRDVWEQVGGFDVSMGLFMEDIDFCWRVHAAGYRVRVITDAICYHVQAATKHRRAISVGRRSRMLDRRNGLLTLLGNLPFGPMLASAGGNVVVSLLRIGFFLLAKRLTAALDEAAAASSVLLHPIRLISMRRRRSAGRRAAYSRIKADLPPGHSLRRLAEFAATILFKSEQTDTAGAHHASVDPTEDDSLLVDNGLGRRLLTSPSLLAFIALLVIALIAGRSLIGGGPLGGGSLIPAWGGASDLWHTYFQAFHPTGLGSANSAPTYLAVLAALSTVLVGKPWLAIDVILIGCVPLAGLSAMLAIRRVTSSALIRVWGSVTYALLPVAIGVVAAGRFGSALAFVLLPLIALSAGQLVTATGPRASRSAWATGLLVAVGAAFVPLLWLVALVGCIITAIVFRNTKAGLLRNLAVVALTAPVLLLPWSLSFFSRPGSLLLEAGLPQPGTPASGLSGKMLILLSPGGPGLPPYWVTAGLLAAALAALFAGRRRQLITAGWGVALAGLLLAVVTSHLVVTPADASPVTVWAGLPLAIAATGLLLAAAVGADALGRMFTGKGWSPVSPGRGIWAALIALVACSAPVLAAVAWLGTGVSGPVHHVSNQVVPELVAVSDGQSRQVRTLVLRSVHGEVSYLLLRGPSPSLGDPDLAAPLAAQQALSKVVAALTTPNGGLAVNLSPLLADFDIGYVLVQAPVSQQLSDLLDGVSGLQPYSTTANYVIWKLTTPPSRVSVLESDGTVVPIPSGQLGVSGATLPSAGGILMLAEPAGGWSASVNGHGLTQVPSPAGSWAQAFQLPAGGGRLDVGYSGLVHDLWLAFEILALLAVIGLALPGIHVADEALRAESISFADVPSPAKPESRARTPGSRARRADPADLDEAAAGAGKTGTGRAAGATASGRAAIAGAAAGLAARSPRGRTRAKSGRGRSAKDRAGRESAKSAGPASSRPDLDRPGRRSADSSVGARAAGRGDRADRIGGDRPSRDLAAQPADWESPDRGGPPWSDRRLTDDSQPLADPRESQPGRLTDAWPHEPARAEPVADSLSGRGSGPHTRAWPYQDDGATDSADSGSRFPASRSPSGAAPPPQWSTQSVSERSDPLDWRPAAGRERDSYQLERPAAARGRDSYELERPAASRGRDSYELEQDEPVQYDSQRSLPGHQRSAGRSADDQDSTGRYQNARDRDSGVRYERDWAEPERSPAPRYELDQPDSGQYQPDSGPYQVARLDSDRASYRPDPDRYDGAGRPPPGRGYTELDDPSLSRYRDEPVRSAERNRWGRGSSPDRPGETSLPRSPAGQPPARGQLEPLPGWSNSGGDSLEPLPPLAGPAQAGSSRPGPWRPDPARSPGRWNDADDDSGEWRRGEPGHPYDEGDDQSDDRRGSSRWSGPQSDYEGESW
jgi:GT2 family glycosyltransferase